MNEIPIKKMTEQLLQWDRDHVIHPKCRPGATRGIVIGSAEGVTLRGIEGRDTIAAFIAEPVQGQGMICPLRNIGLQSGRCLRFSSGYPETG